MFGILSLLLSLKLMLVQVGDLLSLSFSLFFITPIFYILEKKNKKSFDLYSSFFSVICVMMHMRTNIFIFLLSIFLDFIFLFFSFYEQ